MALTTGEVFIWLFFLIITTVLFFAAFGQSEVNESSIEEYMANLIREEREGKSG